MYIYGKNVCKEKLLSKDKINKVYLSNKFNDKEIINYILGGMYEKENS